MLLLLGSGPACAQSGSPDAIVDARDAFAKKDGQRLLALRDKAVAERNPLAMWADYWELNNRLYTANADEVQAFYKRWGGSYVEDRLRNDWLLELGRRRDWKALAADYPRFRMNDDREVSCYAALAEHLDGKDNRTAARTVWLAQRDADDGCALLGATLYDHKVLTEADAWRRARIATDAGRPRAAQQAAALVNDSAGNAVTVLNDNPVRFLLQLTPRTRQDKELATLALMRWANNDAESAAGALAAKWEAQLPPQLAAWAWAAVAKQSAQKLAPEASSYFQRAALIAANAKTDIDWTDDTLAWKARAALRADGGRPRWQQVVQAINAMNPTEQKEPTWVYWKARALLALASDSAEPQALAAQAREMLAGISNQLNFYGMLAADELGQAIALPPAPAPLTAEERQAASREPGLTRAMLLISLGLRNEGVREWNFTLRGMDDRTLLAAAQLACDRELWDRCISASDRTRNEINIAQRYPTPFRTQMVTRSRELGLDPAYVYGLIRQESRFVMDARSGVGASGLMQIMPATARWTAKRIGVPYSSSMITDRDLNLKLGTQYLRLVLDDFDASPLMAAAAYNAGPGRSRRWREGPLIEPAAWAENLPFGETREYVKRVLTNTVIYSALLTNPSATQVPSLKARLGPPVGPRVGPVPAIEKDLP